MAPAAIEQVMNSDAAKAPETLKHKTSLLRRLSLRSSLNAEDASESMNESSVSLDLLNSSRSSTSLRNVFRRSSIKSLKNSSNEGPACQNSDSSKELFTFRSDESWVDFCDELLLDEPQMGGN